MALRGKFLFLSSWNLHLESLVAIETVGLGDRMRVVAYGTGDITQMGVVRVTFGKVFGCSFTRELLQGAVAGKAAAVFYGCIQQRSFFSVASGAVHHGLAV